MDKRQLQYFLSVADALSFSRAAEKHFITQSAMSYQIANLEKELGAELFERSKKGLKLTAAGKTFYRHACTIVRQMAAGLEETRSVANGSAVEVLRIGFLGPTEQHFLPVAVGIFSDQNKNVNVKMKQVQPADAFRLLDEGGLDIVFSMRAHGQRFALDDKYDVENIDRLWLHALLWPGHPLASRKTLVRADFEGERMIFTSRELCPEIYDAFLHSFSSRGIRIGDVTESSTQDSIVYLVRARRGVAIMPKIYAKFDPDLIALPMEGEDEFVDLVAALPKGSTKKKALELIDIARETVRLSANP